MFPNDLAVKSDMVFFKTTPGAWPSVFPNDLADKNDMGVFKTTPGAWPSVFPNGLAVQTTWTLPSLKPEPSRPGQDPAAGAAYGHRHCENNLLDCSKRLDLVGYTLSERGVRPACINIIFL